MSRIFRLEIPKPEQLKEITDLIYQGKEETFNNFIPPSYEEISKIEQNTFLYFCYINGIYHFPTKELISFLNTLIKNKSETIEIGSGTGILGKSLNIHCTDSHIQQTPNVKLMYSLMGQPVIEYPSFVEKIEALDAVVKYKPKTVVASWVTQLYNNNLNDQNQQSFEHGIDEKSLLEKIDQYILIGSTSVHGKKEIIQNGQYNYKTYTTNDVPLISRSERQNNIIYVFEK